MGKAYIDTVKYVIYANVDINGIVEKPDVVGAIFGQTEGLLGEELDLRELQKSGRIGRIEVELESHGNKSSGRIVLPSSLDRVETAILGAALETVDRIGPCEAHITVDRIEDTRTMKREFVVKRAKEILKRMITSKIPESKELAELVREEVKTAELCTYGPEKLPCGPSIADSNEIIIVEGRADVLNLLKADITNVISLQGKNIPRSVAELTTRKTATVFVDGDRGGDLIVKALSEVADIDYVAKAPDGKEVEELTKKEIIKCLRRRIPLNQFMAHTFGRVERHERHRERFERKEQRREREISVNPYADLLKKLNGTLKGVLLDSNSNPIAEVNVKDLADAIQSYDGIHAVVFDGIVTQRLVDLAKQKGIRYLVGARKTQIGDTGDVKVIA